VIAATACGGSTRSVRIRSAVRCAPATFKGASTEYDNYHGDNQVHLSKYKDGKLSIDYSLEMFNFDPYHDNSDVLRQLFFDNGDGCAQRAVPDMGGGPDPIQSTASRRRCNAVPRLPTAAIPVARRSGPSPGFMAPTLCPGRGPLDSWCERMRA
jgi:hypothetical protein